MTSRLRKRLKGTALVALLVFLGSFAEAAFFHTDDGCAVEIHCLACRLILGTTAVAPPTSISGVTNLIDLGAAPPTPAPLVVESAPRTVTTRGPPLA
jgi:hypothetical protein